MSGSELSAQSLKPASDSVSPSLSASSLLMLSPSLSKINKHFLKIKKKRRGNIRECFLRQRVLKLKFAQNIIQNK